MLVAKCHASIACTALSLCLRGPTIVTESFGSAALFMEHVVSSPSGTCSMATTRATSVYGCTSKSAHYRLMVAAWHRHGAGVLWRWHGKAVEGRGGRRGTEVDVPRKRTPYRRGFAATHVRNRRTTRNSQSSTPLFGTLIVAHSQYSGVRLSKPHQKSSIQSRAVWSFSLQTARTAACACGGKQSMMCASPRSSLLTPPL